MNLVVIAVLEQALAGVSTGDNNMPMFYNYEDGDFIAIEAKDEEQAREKLTRYAIRMNFYSGWAKQCEITEIKQGIDGVYRNEEMY